ncbi:MAG: GNAT family N-acetyltransferase [Candidatus Latescibacterota bacterium]|nr:MAG: GNAT family N-acetyltransferase [Candidatus Latescibacterota bacterium]
MARVRVIRRLMELEEYATRWNELVDISSQANVFQRWEWIWNWANVYIGENSLLTLAVLEGNELVAIAPLWVEKKRHPGFVSLNVLRVMGSPESDYVDFIVREDDAARWSELIWEHLFGPLRGEWDILEYIDVRADSSVLDSFARLSASDDRCAKMEQTGQSVCPYIDLPDRWDEFLQSFSSTGRYAINYSRRRLEKQGDLRLHFCENVDELPDQLRRFISLHQKSWRERGRAGAFATDKAKRFHERVAGDFLKKRILFLCSLSLDGTHIGSFYGFQFKNKLYYYLLAVERNPEKRVKTGTALLGYCIEEAITRRCREFDFLRGDEEYKYRWTKLNRENLRLRFYNRKVRVSVFIVYRSIVRTLRRAFKMALDERTSRITEWPQRDDDTIE